jgi:hypothetical protein
LSASVDPKRLFGIYSKSLPRRKSTGEPIAKAEERLQIQCVDFLRLCAWGDVRWIHPSNESHRHIQGEIIQKAMGRVAGTPDLIIWRAYHPDRSFPLYFVEFKSPKASARPSEDQEAFFKDMIELGHRGAVVNSFDGFVEQMIAWGLVCTD